MLLLFMLGVLIPLLKKSVISIQTGCKQSCNKSCKYFEKALSEECCDNK